MKIVFLDFDGVLNSYADIVRGRDYSGVMFNEQAMARLNTIIRRTGAKVVISSSWRGKYDVPKLRTMLASRGFSGEVIAATPLKYRHRTRDPFPGETRCWEIQVWLDAQPEPPRSFAILDDMDLAQLAAFLVQTDTETGLLDHHVETAVALLGTD